MGNGRDSVENASVSAFHNVNLCMGLGSPLLGLAVIQTGLAVQTGLAIQTGLAALRPALLGEKICRYNVLLFLYKTILQVMYLLPTTITM